MSQEDEALGEAAYQTHEALHQCLEIELDPLRVVSAGDTSKRLDDIIDKLADVQPALVELQRRDLKPLPWVFHKQIREFCELYVSVVNQSRNLKPDKPQFENLKTSILARSQQLALEKIETLAPAFAMTLPSELESLKDQLVSLGELDIKAQRLLRHARRSAKSIKSILNELQDSVAEAGVDQSAVHFHQEAERNAKSAHRWLWATSVLAAATLVTAILAVLSASIYSVESVHQGVQLAIAKALLFSLLITITLWSSRNYRAFKHNETLNQHRENALSTFTFFVQGTEDPKIKDTVLMHAAQSAFGPRPTAFEASESDNQAGTQALVNIVERFGPEKSQK